MDFQKLFYTLEVSYLFLLERSVAKNFLTMCSNISGTQKVLFLVEATRGNLRNNLQTYSSNAYIRDISSVPGEEEVLFFPYSCFYVTNITKIERDLDVNYKDYYRLKLEYLGKYNQYILNTDVNNILPFFQTTQYGREILE